MKILGSTFYTDDGIETVQAQMDAIDADTCAFYVKNPVKFYCNPLSKEIIEKFKKMVKNPSRFLIHGSLVLNLVNYKKNTSLKIMLDDLDKCEKLGLKHYNIHPGSNTKKMAISDACTEVAEAINIAMKKYPDIEIIIETMAGQGNYIGKTFEELHMIIEKIEDKSRIGITLDTCHIFCAGYDIRTQDSFAKVMKEFDEIIGLRYLSGVHLNDSKQPFNSRRDKHQAIGKGYIGEEAFKFIMNSDIFENIPMVLETPDHGAWKDEITLLRSFIKKK